MCTMIPIAFMNSCCELFRIFIEGSYKAGALWDSALCWVFQNISLSEKMAVATTRRQNHPYPTEGSYWKEVCHQVT